MLLYNTMKTSFSPLEFLGGRHTHGWWTRWQANEIASRETWKGPWSEDLLAMALLPILSLYSLVIFSFHGLITCPSINPKPNTITGRGLEIDATSLSFSGRSNHLPILIIFWEASVMDHSHARHAWFDASWFLPHFLMLRDFLNLSPACQTHQHPSVAVEKNTKKKTILLHVD
jgi:hypothetical protein